MPSRALPRSPATEAVLTTCPSSWATSVGRKTLQPWMTPNRLTPTTQSHSSTGLSTIERPTTPALLHTTWTAPKCSRVRLPQGHHRGVVGDVGRDAGHLGAAVGELRHGRLQYRLLDVGQHQAHARIGEPSGHREADPARAPGHDGDLPGELLHRLPPAP